MADREAERIKFETELLRVTALAALAIGGGSIGFLLGDPNPLRLILAGGGLLGRPHVRALVATALYSDID